MQGIIDSGGLKPTVEEKAIPSFIGIKRKYEDLLSDFYGYLPIAVLSIVGGGLTSISDSSIGGFFDFMILLNCGITMIIILILNLFTIRLLDSTHFLAAGIFAPFVQRTLCFCILGISVQNILFNFWAPLALVIVVLAYLNGILIVSSWFSHRKNLGVWNLQSAKNILLENSLPQYLMNSWNVKADGIPCETDLVKNKRRITWMLVFTIPIILIIHLWVVGFTI